MTIRWFAILAMVVSTAVWACDSSSGDNKDVVTADTPTDVVQPTDTHTDPGSNNDPGTFDPGPGDPGTDPGPTDIVAQDTPTVDVPVGCPAVVSGPNCNAIAACALQCEGPAREAECVGTAVTAEKTKWETLRDCLATAACPKVYDNEQFTECVMTNCGEALDGCFAATSGKCCAIVNCRKDCDPDDPSCPMRCYGLASREEQAVYVTYKDCVLGTECAATDVRANGWPTWTCEAYSQNHNCPLQAQECFPTSGCN